MPTRATALAFMNNIIEPAIQQIGLWSPAAAILLLGTAVQESGLIHRRQLGGGPALGLFQMEPVTHDDTWDSYLEYRPALAQKVMAVAKRTEQPEAEWLVSHDEYAAAMARVKYLRYPQALPPADDIGALAMYWKAAYNTYGGSGNAQDFLDNWHAVMGDDPADTRFKSQG